MSPVDIAKPSDFAEPETQVFTLPRAVGGKTLAVRIRAVPIPQIIVALEGVPGLNKAKGKEEQTWEQAREAILAQDIPTKRIAKMGLVEPVFSFAIADDADDPADAPRWSNVHAENQQAIVNAVMSLSGFDSKGADAKAAEEFRDVAPK